MDGNQNIEKTINCICDWIQKKMEPDGLFKDDNNKEVVEMTKALAELVSARAKMQQNKIDIKKIQKSFEKQLKKSGKPLFSC